MHISQLPPEMLTRIFRFGSGPFETFTDTSMPDMPWDADRNDRDGYIETGFYRYEIAETASQVCQLWRDIISRDADLHYLIIDLSPLNPKKDHRLLHKVRIEGGGIGYESCSSDEYSSDYYDNESGSEAEFTFEERFNRRLTMAENHPTCDILLYMPAEIHCEEIGLSHFKDTPTILTQCASRIRLLSCCLLEWITDANQYYENIMLTLFGGSAHFPRLEYLRFEVDLTSDFGHFFSESKMLISNIPQTVSVPNLRSLITWPCPWYYIKQPAFRNLQHLRLFELGEDIKSPDPKLWQMVNACPRLEVLHISWESAYSKIEIPLFPRDAITTLHHLPVLKMEFIDKMAWPILMNLNLPKLERLEVYLMQESRNPEGFNSWKDMLVEQADYQRPVFNIPNLKTLKIYPIHIPTLEFLSSSTFAVLESFHSQFPESSFYVSNEFKGKCRQPLMDVSKLWGYKIEMLALRDLVVDEENIILKWFSSQFGVKNQGEKLDIENAGYTSEERKSVVTARELHNTGYYSDSE